MHIPHENISVISIHIRLFSCEAHLVIVSYNFHVTVTSFSVFYFYYYCLLESVKKIIMHIPHENISVISIHIRLFSCEARLVIVSCNFHVTVTSFSVFYLYYYCLLESVKK